MDTRMLMVLLIFAVAIGIGIYSVTAEQDDNSPAAIKGHYDRHSLEIINDVRAGIGFETDPYEATKLNVLNSMMLIADDMMDDSATIVGAVYDTQSGRVEFLL